MSECFKVKVGQRFKHESENGYYEVLCIHKNKSFIKHVDRFERESSCVFDIETNLIFCEEQLLKEQGE